VHLGLELDIENLAISVRARSPYDLAKFFLFLFSVQCRRLYILANGLVASAV
jgi:hypothetical protein